MYRMVEYVFPMVLYLCIKKKFQNVRNNLFRKMAILPIVWTFQIKKLFFWTGWFWYYHKITLKQKLN